MSESTFRIIGTKQYPKKRTLNFVILCETHNMIWTTEASIEDLNTTFKNISRSLFLLSNFVWTKLESYEISYLSKLTEEINAYFYQLRYRLDILCHPLIQELLSVPYSDYPLELMSHLKVSETYSVSSVSVIPETHNIIAACEYSSVFKRIGKLWSLIEAQHYGQITICGFDEALYRIETTEIKEQIKSCYWKKNTFEAIFGLENGNLLLVSFKMKLGPNSKGIYDGEKLSIGSRSTYKIHGSPIIAITGADDLLITLSIDSILKISTCKRQFNETESIETIGGGSLKQRLNSIDLSNSKPAQSSKLISLFFDQVTKKIFLGSDHGKILVYLLENSVPKYQYTVNCGDPVWDLEVSLGCMYLAVGESIVVYTDTKEYEILARFRPYIEDCKITCIKYLQSKEYLFAAFSNGMLLIWHAVIFQLLVAVKVFDDPIICMKIDETSRILVVCNVYSEMKMFKI